MNELIQTDALTFGQSCLLGDIFILERPGASSGLPVVATLGFEGGHLSVFDAVCGVGW